MVLLRGFYGLEGVIWLIFYGSWQGQAIGSPKWFKERSLIYVMPMYSEMREKIIYSSNMRTNRKIIFARP